MERRKKMNRKFCDRCGKEMNINPIVQVQNPLFEIRQIYPRGNMPIDLCENCSKKFIEWVKVAEDGKIDADALREQISKDPREVFTKHQVWLFASEHNKTVPTVEAIPKDQYEARLKADMVAMLTDIQLEIEEMSGLCTEIHGDEWNEINTVHSQDVLSLIQQKIDKLKGEE